ncbi:MAG: hypothetical protein J2P36_27125, partial [Ktedonobacteraceae bacterium]|nr:hypothetical protein [Ktedonobacteraceae bacterium]
MHTMFRAFIQRRSTLLVLAFLGVLFAQFSISGTPATAATNQADIDQVVRQVLIDQGTNGWDAKYKGMLINWRRDDLSKVNCSSSSCDRRGHSTRHDGQNDLRYLENLYWYKSRHPNDQSTDQHIAAILPTVKKGWGNTNLPKGWVYYILLRLARYSPESAYWNQAAQHWAAAQYQSLDQNLGVHHGRIVTSTGPDAITLKDAYRVDHALETGLALVDAGTRYHQSAWVKAGQREVDIVVRQSFSNTYHLFNRIYLLSDSKYGSNKVIDHQARLGEQGQELEALVRTGIATNNQQYLNLAAQMLDALQSQPIHDRQSGGFYFKMYLGTDQSNPAGSVSKGSKETRQLHVLASVHLANGALGNRWPALEQELTALATTPN